MKRGLGGQDYGSPSGYGPGAGIKLPIPDLRLRAAPAVTL